MQRVLATCHGIHRDLQELQDNVGLVLMQRIFPSIVFLIKEAEQDHPHAGNIMARVAASE